MMDNWFICFLGAACGCFIMDYVKPRWPRLWEVLGVIAVIVMLSAFVQRYL